jgi:2-haloacid dehalogenase
MAGSEIRNMIDWKNIKALSFDCYGTLIDWESGMLSALKPWVAEFGRQAVLAGFASVEPSIEHAHPTWPYRQVISEVYHQMADEFGVEVNSTDAFAFAVSVGLWPPFPDSVPALRRLKKRFRLYLLSNVDEVSISGTLGQLETEFDGVYTAEAIGSYKPDVRNFEYLLKRIDKQGIVQSQMVHVAQSLYHDHVPAKQLGLQTVWIDRTEGRTGAAVLPDPIPRYDARFATLAELADHIETHEGK